MPPPVFNTVEVNKRLLNLIKALPDEIERALIAEANDVLTHAKYLTPVDTGALRDSGQIVEMKAQGSHEVSVGIMFGGYEPSSAYAIYVHEDPNAKHAAPTQYMFLDTAISQAEAGMLQRLKERIKLERLI